MYHSRIVGAVIIFIAGYNAAFLISRATSVYNSPLKSARHVTYGVGKKTELVSAPNRFTGSDIGSSILVTGAGAGFIGMHTSIDELKKRGFHVVALDNMNEYYSLELKQSRLEQLSNNGVSFVKGDICDDHLLRTIFRDHAIDRVVHLAAQAGVRYSLKSPKSYIKNNVDCFVTILEEFVKEGLHKKPIIYASSSSVYGFDNDPRFAEDVSDVDHPTNKHLRCN